MSWLPLDAACTDARAGLFMAALARSYELDPRAGPAAVAQALIAEEMLVLQGGLRLTDTITGATIAPSCCEGLEEWREWSRLLVDEHPSLGHDPDTLVEFHSGEFRVRQDEVTLVLPRAELPDLLARAQRDLAGFLTPLATWARHRGLGATGAALVGTIDRQFAITAPMLRR